jgi:hypothetical protein
VGLDRLQVLDVNKGLVLVSGISKFGKPNSQTKRIAGRRQHRRAGHGRLPAPDAARLPQGAGATAGPAAAAAERRGEGGAGGRRVVGLHFGAFES